MNCTTDPDDPVLGDYEPTGYLVVLTRISWSNLAGSPTRTRSALARAGAVFIRPDESDGHSGVRRRAGLGDGERQADHHANRPERRIDHPQGHHAKDSRDPAAEPRPRRALRPRRVRGLLAGERKGEGHRGDR